MNEIATLPDLSTAQLPALYETAKVALAECAEMDECKGWADKAAALASYGRQAKDETMMRMAERIRARAIRRAGEIIDQIEPAKGGKPFHSTSGSVPTSKQSIAKEAGFSRDQMHTAQRVARIPEAAFEAMVESAAPPTLTAMAALGTDKCQPLIDLKGRDPDEFNRALHFVGEFEHHLRWLQKQDLALVLPGLDNDERQRLRSTLSALDTIHDHIMTRI